MGYTAKHFVSLSDLTVQNLNEMELGIQEAHDDTEELDKRLTSLAIDISGITKDLNTLTQDSSAALQAIKDIDNILKQDEELSTVLKNYGTNFLSKDPQVLTDSELRNVYKNLCLTDYQFFKEVKLNGKPITGSTLEINYPEIDTSLNIVSNNSVSNKAITQKLNAIESTFNYYTKTDVIYDHIFNTITSEMFLRQQEDQELRDSLENHTHNDMATKTFVRKEISLIPTPDVSGQINAHNLDKSAHPDIWKAIENMDLSDYALVGHNHDNSYSKLDHTHDYADSDHTHDMSDYVTISTDQVVTGKKRFVVSSGYSSPSIAKFFVGPADNTGFAFGNDGMQAFSGGNYSTMYINYYGGNVQIGNNKNNTLIAQKGSFADTISEEGKLLKDKYAALTHEHDYAPSTHEHNYLPLSGGTLTGNLTGRYITGTWLQSTSHTNLNATPTTYPVFDSKGWIYSRTLAEMKTDLNVPTDYATSSHNHEGVYAPATHSHNYATQADIDTSINTFKSWLFDVGEADTIDTIKDIVDEMKAHHDILDALANTYAPKDHAHTNYLPLSGSEVDNVTTYPMTGGITLAPAGIKSLKWQANSASQGYYAYTRYDQNGDEGLTFGTGNNKVSVLFRTDGDMTSTWNQGTPTLHMKNNTVTINKVISGNNASYTLDVGGSIHGTTLYENGVSLDSAYLKLSGGKMTGSIETDTSTNVALITDGTYSLFDLEQGALYVGASYSSPYELILRGKTDRPTYTGPTLTDTVALTSDLENYVTKTGYSMRASSTVGKFYYNTGAGEKAIQVKMPTIPDISGKLTGTKFNANNPDVYCGYNNERNTSSLFMMSFKNNSNEYGFCHSPFANVYGKDGGVTTPSNALYNGFYYVSSTTNSLSGADANPFIQYHTSNNDFRILTTGYDGAESSPLWVQQIATDFRTEHVYVRRKENGSWKDWKKLAFNSDVDTCVKLTGDQTITGVKTLSTTSGFNYSGIENATSDTFRHVWFSHTTNKGTPVYNDSLKFNPLTKKMNVGGLTIGGADSNNHTISSSSAIIRFGDSSNVSNLAVLANDSANKFLRPGAAGTMDLGTNTYKWKDIYLSGCMNSTTANVAGDLTTRFVKPASNDTYSLGSTTNRFMQVVADEHVITQNGSSSVYWKINVDSNGNLVFKHS